MSALDEDLLRALNQLSAIPLLAMLGTALSSRWMLAVIGGPIALCLVSQKRFAALLSIALAMGASDQLSAHLIKPLVARERPCHVLSGLTTPTGCGRGESFPSSHATNAFALAVAAAPELPYGWALLLPAAALVSASRISLGQHYPSDVLGGALLGALVGALAQLILRRRRRAARPVLIEDS